MIAYFLIVSFMLGWIAHKVCDKIDNKRIEKDKEEDKEAMEYDLIPLNNIGKTETVKVSNQAYVNKQCNENAELKAKLTKAKEIIKALLKHTHGQNLNTQNDFDLYLGRIKEAKQFLKECDIYEAIQQANEDLDFDKIADEIEQDLTE